MSSPPAAWLIIGFFAGCSQPSVPHPGPVPATTRSSDVSSVVTRLELDRSAPSGNLMVALQKIRPTFLTARGGTPIVSLDGLVFADASVLRNIPVTDVCEVRFRRGASSSSTHSVVLAGGGVSSGDDLIEVSLRHDSTTGCQW